jgi:hypothetical protein
MQPKGFGKKYFTLASIQAHTVHMTLSRITTKVISQHFECSYEDESDQSVEDEELLLLEGAHAPLSYGSPQLKPTDSSYSSNAPPPILHVILTPNHNNTKGLL